MRCNESVEPKHPNNESPDNRPTRSVSHGHCDRALNRTPPGTTLRHSQSLLVCHLGTTQPEVSIEAAEVTPQPDGRARRQFANIAVICSVSSHRRDPQALKRGISVGFYCLTCPTRRTHYYMKLRSNESRGLVLHAYWHRSCHTETTVFRC